MGKDQKTILFSPLNSAGHINSSIALADSLSQMYGHRIVFLIIGDMTGSVITDHGHEVYQIADASGVEVEESTETDEAGKDEAKEPEKPKRVLTGAHKWPELIKQFCDLPPVEAMVTLMPIMRKTMIGALAKNLEAHSKSLASIKPDLIISDEYMKPPGVLKAKVPWVNLWSACPYFVVKSKMPDGVKPPPMCGFRLMNKEAREKMRQEEPEKWQAMLDEWRQASDRVREGISNADDATGAFWEEHGIEPPEPGKMGHESPYLNLYTYPKELDYDQDDDLLEYAPRWLRAEGMVREAFGKQSDVGCLKYWTEELAKAKKGKKEVIYFSMGTLVSGDITRMKRLIEMFKTDTERLYIVSKGINGDQYELYDNMIGGNYIPQTFFLERVDLAIVHGGNNTVMECCYFGLPMIVLPSFADQLDNACRVDDSKIGKYLSIKDCTKEQMMQAINETLADHDMIARCRKMGERLRKQDHSGKIAFVVDKLMRDGNLTEDFIKSCQNKDLEEIQNTC